MRKLLMFWFLVIGLTQSHLVMADPIQDLVNVNGVEGRCCFETEQATPCLGLPDPISLAACFSFAAAPQDNYLFSCFSHTSASNLTAAAFWFPHITHARYIDVVLTTCDNNEELDSNETSPDGHVIETKDRTIQKVYQENAKLSWKEILQKVDKENVRRIKGNDSIYNKRFQNPTQSKRK